MRQSRRPTVAEDSADQLGIETSHWPAGTRVCVVKRTGVEPFRSSTSENSRSGEKIAIALLKSESCRGRVTLASRETCRYRRSRARAQRRHAGQSQYYFLAQAVAFIAAIVEKSVRPRSAAFGILRQICVEKKRRHRVAGDALKQVLPGAHAHFSIHQLKPSLWSADARDYFFGRPLGRTLQLVCRVSSRC